MLKAVETDRVCMHSGSRSTAHAHSAYSHGRSGLLLSDEEVAAGPRDSQLLKRTKPSP